MLDFAVFCPENMKKITLALVDKSDFLLVKDSINGAKTGERKYKSCEPFITFVNLVFIYVVGGAHRSCMLWLSDQRRQRHKYLRVRIVIIFFS